MNEGLDYLLAVAIEQRLTDFVIRNDFVQSVGAQEKDVAILGVPAPRIQIQCVVGSNRAGYHVGQPVLFRILAIDKPLIYELLQRTVILCHLNEVATSHAIDPAVPGPEADHLPIHSAQDSDRAADRPAVELRFPDLSKRPVYVVHLLLDVLHEPKLHCHLANAFERIDNHTARHLPSNVAAHAVGDGPKAYFGGVEPRILV